MPDKDKISIDPDKLAVLIKILIGQKWYGTLAVEIVGGQIVLLRKQETFKKL